MNINFKSSLIGVVLALFFLERGIGWRNTRGQPRGRVAGIAHGGPRKPFAGPERSLLLWIRNRRESGNPGPGGRSGT